VAVAPSPSGGEPDQENLPKRPRGVTLAEASRAQAPPAPRPPATGGSAAPSAPAPAPVDRGARFAAFRQAGEQNRNGPPPPGPFDDGTAPRDEWAP
jgi:hypothetical protein